MMNVGESLDLSSANNPRYERLSISIDYDDDPAETYPVFLYVPDLEGVPKLANQGCAIMPSKSNNWREFRE